MERAWPALLAAICRLRAEAEHLKHRTHRDPRADGHEVDRAPNSRSVEFHRSLIGGFTLLVSRLSHRTALLACLRQSSIAFLEDCLVLAVQLIDGRHISNRAV